VLDFITLSSGTRASPLVLLEIGYDYPDDLPTVQVEMPPPEIVIRLSSHIFCQFFISIFSLGQTGLSVTALPILTLCLWENLSRLMSSRLILPVSEPPTT
jgi:hypothetical protein